MRCKKILLSFIILGKIIIIFLGALPICVNSEIINRDILVLSSEPENSRFESGSTELDYQEYFSLHYEVLNNIRWEFESSKDHIGIKVVLVEEESFDEFQEDNSYWDEILSKGNKSKDSGEIKVWSEAVWYIIFINEDPDQESTTLTYKVDFNVYSEDLMLFLIIYLSVFFSIIGVVITIVIYFKRKPKIEEKKEKKKVEVFYQSIDLSQEQKANQIPNHDESQEESNLSIILESCPYCGKKLAHKSDFCHDCGSKLY